MKLCKRGFQVFKTTHRWVTFNGKVVEDSDYLIKEWTGWRWKPYKDSGVIRLFTDYEAARGTAESLAAATKAKRENRRSLGIFQEPVEEIIWV